jgi:hypothetical protein
MFMLCNRLAAPYVGDLRFFAISRFFCRIETNHELPLTVNQILGRMSEIEQ